MVDGNRFSEGHRATDKTLAEQLQITDREIEYRKSLLNITDADVNLLKTLKNIIIGGIDEIVDCFYDIQLKTREISLLIGDAETLDRLRMSMHRYVLELFEGYYDAEYVNKRLRIGKVHKRIGVSPKLYVSAVNLLEVVLDDYLQNNLHQLPNNGSHYEAQRRALHKLLMFDMQLVFDTYISSLVAEVQTAKAELEDYTETLEATVVQRTHQLQELSLRDNLTGLFNQRAFFENLRRELSVAERTHRPISIVYFDLNGFKNLNDTKGHREGDRLLECVGQAISESIRDVDFGCRYGGDEFSIIMPSANSKEAKHSCERLITAYDAIRPYDTTFSVGIADTGPEIFLDPDSLIKNADQMMYAAKTKSKEQSGHHIMIELDA